MKNKRTIVDKKQKGLQWIKNKKDRSGLQQMKNKRTMWMKNKKDYVDEKQKELCE